MSNDSANIHRQRNTHLLTQAWNAKSDHH